MNDKPLPACPDLERKVLAVVLMEADHLPRLLADGVTDADFLGDFNRRVWRFIVERGGATPEAVNEAFPDDVIQVAELLCIATTAGLDRWIAELRRMTARRKIIIAANDASRAAYDLQTPMDDALAALTAKAASAADAWTGQRRPDFVSQIGEYSAAQDAGTAAGERIPYGLPTDSKLCHRRREIHVLGAKPATGKTNLALNAMLGTITRGFRPALYCQEMPINRLLARMIAALSGVQYNDIQTGKQRDTCRPIEEKLRQMAAKDVLHIRGAGDYRHSVEAIREDLRRYREDAGRVDLVIIDYLQNMQAARHLERVTDMRRIIDWNVCALQQLAADFDCALLVLSQLNRESQKTGRADMTALKESSMIEQAASIVSLMERADQTPEPDFTRPVPIKFNCVKYRDGQPFEMRLMHDGSHCKFTEAGKYGPDDDP